MECYKKTKGEIVGQKIKFSLKNCVGWVVTPATSLTFHFLAAFKILNQLINSISMFLKLCFSVEVALKSAEIRK